MKEVETLAPRVNLLEKQLSSIHVRQKVMPVRSGAIHTDKRHYYEIKEGDNLFRISQKYGLSVEELARLNDLREEPPWTEVAVSGSISVLKRGKQT
jgi:hypothetical protein